MRIALLNTKPTARSKYLLGCFTEGALVHGDETFVVHGSEGLDLLDEADVGVQVCYPNIHHNGNTLAEFRLSASLRLRESNKRILTIDTGFIRSQPEAELACGFKSTDRLTYEAFDKQIYYSVGYDGLKNAADYCTDGVSGKRWKRLEVDIQPWRSGGTHIVVIGQPLFGLSTQHRDVYAWYAEVASALARTGSRRKVVFRQHPRISTLRTKLKKVSADRSSVSAAMRPVLKRLTFSANRLLRDDLVDAWAVIALTSNAAVEAVVAGVPVVACDKGNMAWPVAARSVDRIEDPHKPGRSEWASRLAYSQWNPEEMRSGACWDHLRPHALTRSKS